MRRREVEKNQRADLRPWSWVSKASAGNLVGLGIGEMGREVCGEPCISSRNISTCRKKLAGFRRF